MKLQIELSEFKKFEKSIWDTNNKVLYAALIDFQSHIFRENPGYADLVVPEEILNNNKNCLHSSGETRIKVDGWKCNDCGSIRITTRYYQ